MATHAETRALWRERVLAFRASGMSRRAFAREHGLNPSTLGNWLSRIDENGEVLPTSREQARQAQSSEPERQWVSLIASDDNASPSASPVSGGKPNVSLHVAGVTIEVRPGFDEDLLISVLRVVKSAC